LSKGLAFSESIVAILVTYHGIKTGFIFWVKVTDISKKASNISSVEISFARRLHEENKDKKHMQ
jgi:hypothetical protein